MAVHARVVLVIVGGVVSGVVASLLLITDPALGTFEALKVVAGPLGMVLFWVGPACIGAGSFRILRSYASGVAI